MLRVVSRNAFPVTCNSFTRFSLLSSSSSCSCKISHSYILFSKSFFHPVVFPENFWIRSIGFGQRLVHFSYFLFQTGYVLFVLFNTFFKLIYVFVDFLAFIKADFFGFFNFPFKLPDSKVSPFFPIPSSNRFSCAEGIHKCHPDVVLPFLSLNS